MPIDGVVAEVREPADEPSGDINKIIDCFVDLNNICRTCGQDHSSTPKYEDIRSSIDFLNNSKENSNPLK